MRLILLLPWLAACSLITDPGSYESGGGRDGGTEDTSADTATMCTSCAVDTFCLVDRCVDCLIDDHCGGGQCVNNSCVASGDSPCCFDGDCMVDGFGVEVRALGVVDTGVVSDGTGMPRFNLLQVAPIPGGGGWFVARRDPMMGYQITSVSESGENLGQDNLPRTLNPFTDCGEMIPPGMLLDLTMRGDGGNLTFGMVLGGADGVRLYSSGGDTCRTSDAMPGMAEGYLTQGTINGAFTVGGYFREPAGRLVVRTHPSTIMGPIMGMPRGLDGTFDLFASATDMGFELYDNAGLAFQDTMVPDGPVRIDGGGGFWFTAHVEDGEIFVGAFERVSGNVEPAGGGFVDVFPSISQLGMVFLDSGGIGNLAVISAEDDDVVLSMPDDLLENLSASVPQTTGRVDGIEASVREVRTGLLEVAAAVRVGTNSKLARWYVCEPSVAAL